MIFDRIYETGNLEEAWAKVRMAKTPPGIDRISCDDFSKNLSMNLHTIGKQLREEAYRPLPVVVFDKRKEKGKSRTIGLSAVRDKVVQQAVLRVIGPYFESEFLPCSCAYRPKRSALSAVKKAGDLVKSGNLWCLQMDVERFFDTMDHNILLELIRKRIDEKPLPRLISRLLKAKIFKEMGLFDNTVGSQQGSGLSPLLSNIYMHPMDLFLWKKYGENYLRYSDDITLLATEKSTVEEARQIIERCLNEMKLSTNKDKTTVQHVSGGIVYLGYHIDIKGQGPDRKSVQQLQRRLEQFDKIRKSDNVPEKLGEIKAVIRGWYNYYKSLKPVKPPNILSLIALVSLAGEVGETGTARELLRQSGDYKQNHPQVAYELGELYAAMGMENRAMREYAKTLELDPARETAKEKVRALQEDETDIYKAIDKIQLVLHHNPVYREGYLKLAEYYSELGLYGFAEKAHEKALEIDDDAGQAPPSPQTPVSPPETDGFDYRSLDQELFLSIFSGRKDAHARQWIDDRGRWGFMRVDRPLKKKDIYKHLKGEITLAVYPVTESDTVNFIVFDVDTAKRKLLESDGEAVAAFRKKAHEDVLRIKTVCLGLELKLYIEDSGYKGRHGWLFFAEPVPATTALKLGQEIMKKAGGPSESMIWELFPMGKSDRHKSTIKLPLGLNRKNNRRCLFLNDGGEPVENQSLFLRTIERNDQQRFTQLTGNDQKASPDGDGKSSPLANIPAGLQKMVAGCHVIRHLVAKAADTNYLTHYERLCLLYTLTFAGDEGCDYLHRVIAYCVNYNRQYTARKIELRKNSPISCAKISEYFPVLVESLDCDCTFENRPMGSYPSPALYLLESEIEKAYVMRPDAEEAEKETDHTSEEDDAAELPGDGETVLDFEKLFNSEPINMEAVPEEREDAPDNSGTTAHKAETKQEAAPSPACFAAPVEAPGETTDAEATAPFILNPHDMPESIGEPIHDTATLVTDTLDAWELALRLMQLKHQREMIGRELISVQDSLKGIFDIQGTDFIRTPAGFLSREKEKNGEWAWVLKS